MRFMKLRSITKLHVIVILLVAALTAACGGGGGGGSAPPAPTLTGTYAGTWSCSDGSSGNSYASLTQDGTAVTGYWEVTGSQLIQGQQPVSITLPSATDVEGQVETTYSSGGHTLKLILRYNPAGIAVGIVIDNYFTITSQLAKQ